MITYLSENLGSLRYLKGNITIVCAQTANAAWFFPATIVVTSNATQTFQRRMSRLFVSGVSMLQICFTGHLLRENSDLLANFEKKIKQCIILM